MRSRSEVRRQNGVRGHLSRSTVSTAEYMTPVRSLLSCLFPARPPLSTTHLYIPSSPHIHDQVPEHSLNRNSAQKIWTYQQLPTRQLFRGAISLPTDARSLRKDKQLHHPPTTTVSHQGFVQAALVTHICQPFLRHLSTPLKEAVGAHKSTSKPSSLSTPTTPLDDQQTHRRSSWLCLSIYHHHP